MIYRQGDVILEEINKLPKGLILSGKKLMVEGETGEVHTMEADVFKPLVVRGIPLPEYGEYAVVKHETQIVHSEHPSLDIPPGTYSVRRVRTYISKRRAVAVWE